MATIKGRTVAILLGGLTLAGASLLVAQQVIHKRQRAELAQTVAKAKAAGLGVDASFFNTSVPDSLNAWVKAKPRFLTSTFGVSLPGSTKWTAQERAKNLTFLIKERPALQPVQDNDTLPWIPRRDYSRPLNILYNDYPYIGGAIRVFAVSGYEEGIKGNWKTATREFQTAARLCNSFTHYSENNPVSLNFCVQKMLALLLQETKGDSRVSKLVKSINPILQPLDLQQIAAAQSAASMAMVDSIETNRTPLREAIYGLTDIETNLIPPPNFATFRTAILKYHMNVLSAIRSHSDDNIAASTALSYLSPPTYQGWQAEYYLAFFLMPDFSGLPLQVGTDIAMARLLDTAVDIYAYKTTHGNFPNSLSSLPGHTPLDPFSKKPLNYRLQEKGFVLWSVGQDGTDDGGQLIQDRNPDLIFQTADPTHPPLLGR